MKQPFIHLHHHSSFSTQDAIGSPEEIIENCIEKGFDSIAITDHGNLDSFASFYLACQNKYKDFFPIFGVEFYMVEDIEKTDIKIEELKLKKKKKEIKGKEYKEKFAEARRNYHIILLAKNKEGLSNIFQLVYESYKNLYYKPRIDKKLIKKYSKNLICLSGCLSGYMNNFIEDKKEVKFFQDIFKDDLYIEIQFNEMKQQKEQTKLLLKKAKEYKIKFVYTNDGHYLEKGQHLTQEALLMINGKKTISSKDRFSFDTKNLYIKTVKDIKEFNKKYNYKISKKDFDVMLKNSIEIKNKIEKIELDTSPKLMKFPDSYNKIKLKCEKELKRRGLDNKKYKDRLKFELSVIKKKKIADYFYLVYLITKEMRKEMFVGAGRGSGVSSLVNFLLNITRVDPIKHGLLFYRFLSEDRGDIPDIDLDFENQDRVKEFLREKFGEENVARISTIETFQIKQTIKDICRIFELYEFKEINKKTKMFDKELETLEENDENFEKNISFKYLKENSEIFKNIFKTKKYNIENIFDDLYGQIRHKGLHAGGIIILPELNKKAPLRIMKDKNEIKEAVIPFSEGQGKNDLSGLGFIKLDILGIKTLSIMNYVIKKNNLSINDLYKIDFEDKKIYDFIYKEKNLTGIFQFETPTMAGLIRRLEPDNFNLLVSLNALARPGTLHSGITDEFIERRMGRSEVVYDHPILEKTLKNNYGLMIFQEDIMMVLHKLAGFEMSVVNKIRKLLSKKLSEGKAKINKYKKEFIIGCKKVSGIEKEKAEKIWKDIEMFTTYSFNLAHSCAYTYMAYQCSYLKTYYLFDFYESLFNIKSESNFSKIKNEAKKNGAEFSKIDINTINKEFYHKEKTFYFGMNKIKGIGDKAADVIIEERNKKKFKSFEDFLSRDIDFRVVNKRVVNCLILIDAFHNITEMNQRELMIFFEEFRKNKNKKKKIKIKIEKIEDFAEEEKIENEVKLLSCNWSYDPWDWKKVEKIKSKLQRFDNTRDGRDLLLVAKVKEYKAKNGLMAFVSGEDIDGDLRDITIFANHYEKNSIKENAVYLFYFWKDDRGLKAKSNKRGIVFRELKEIKV